MAESGSRALVIAILVLTGAARLPAAANDQDQTVASHPMIGEMAPSFELREVGGDTMSLDSLKGRYVVIHFGASW